VENGIVSEERNKPVLDEQTLAKLLEAAYVLQEHNREVRELELDLDLKRAQIEAEEKKKSAASSTQKTSKPRESEAAGQGDYTFTLAQIVATQHQIQIRHLDFDKAMALIAERVIEIARASGAAIGILDGNKIRYRAVAGSQTLKASAEIPLEKALCLPCIRNGQVFRCGDVDPEFLIDSQECRRRGIQSLIAVPIFHEGEVAGGLELYYPTQNGFSEQEIHTGQLMAGLVTEALARDEEMTWKQSLANERAVMLEALEKLKPNLSAMVDPAVPTQPAFKSSSFESASYTCAKCGNKLMNGEQFCGQCGAPRTSGAVPTPAIHETFGGENLSDRVMPELETSNFLHSDVPHSSVRPGTESEESLPESLEDEFPDLFGVPKAPAAERVVAKEVITAPLDPQPNLMKGELEQEPVLEPTFEAEQNDSVEQSEALALAKVEKPDDWSSAASARDFLEQVAEAQQKSGLARFWDARRGDIYLAVAVLLVACVIRWGIWSNHPVSATSGPNPAPTKNHKVEPDADLSAFDRMMISLGLAQAPEPPEDKGNPSIRVWVDLKTALYYCPGTDLYGKTPKGKYSTQRDAQLDQYEPAYRKACE
jgi:putative methionine-R-sulfoxide reductase with GAF domain